MQVRERGWAPFCWIVCVCVCVCVCVLDGLLGLANEMWCLLIVCVCVCVFVLFVSYSCICERIGGGRGEEAYWANIHQSCGIGYD
jgi:uncharacterized membrane protein